MLSVYHPMGALTGLKMETTRVLCSWDMSCACQLPPLVPLDSENTAFVLADSEGEGPVRKTGVSRNQGVLAGLWGESRFQYNHRGPLRDVMQRSATS